jgi:hypothetical protein
VLLSWFDRRGIVPSFGGKRRQMSRNNRKAKPTPKGEAARSLKHAKERFAELESFAFSDDKERFVYHLNDFVRCARAVAEFLPKESGQGQGYREWVKREVQKLQHNDKLFDFFYSTLRNISEHDCLLEPDLSHLSASIGDILPIPRDSVGYELRDAKTGRIISRKPVKPVEATKAADSPSKGNLSRRYYLQDWPKDDILTFCKKVIVSLEELVEWAYKQYP